MFLFECEYVDVVGVGVVCVVWRRSGMYWFRTCGLWSVIMVNGLAYR